jgi:succinyl-CoA synthetase beta subunit
MLNPTDTAAEGTPAALSEYQSKKMLRAYGIPVTREILVQTPDDAVAAARKIGFPVALKASSPELLHKSEANCIELGLKTDEDVTAAFNRIARGLTLKPEGFLVQEMVSGQRELVIGLNRDPQFGPCVMLGLGGVMTEIFQDTVFRVAPLDRLEALDMIDELASKELLGPFRGLAAADIETICKALMAVGKLGLDNESITEIDINPLIIDPAGRPVAVDALIIMESV